MLLNGTTVYVLQNFKPNIIRAIKWNQTSDSNYQDLDRGITQDVYQTSVSIYSTYQEISAVESLFQSNRQTFVLTLSAGEELFGPHIDYSGSISATVKQYNPLQRENFKMYSLDLVLQGIALSAHPNISGTNITTSLANIKHVQSRETDRTWEINKLDSYGGSFAYIEHSSDVGTCNLTLRSYANPISASSIAQVVKALVTSTRGSSFTFPSSWAEQRPFGPRSPGPWVVKCIKWDLPERSSPNYQDLVLTLVEVV